MLVDHWLGILKFAMKVYYLMLNGSPTEFCLLTKNSISV